MATMITRTRLDVTLYVHCLSCKYLHYTSADRRVGAIEHIRCIFVWSRFKCINLLAPELFF